MIFDICPPVYVCSKTPTPARHTNSAYGWISSQKYQVHAPNIANHYHYAVLEAKNSCSRSCNRCYIYIHFDVYIIARRWLNPSGIPKALSLDLYPTEYRGPNYVVFYGTAGTACMPFPVLPKSRTLDSGRRFMSSRMQHDWQLKTLNMLSPSLSPSGWRAFSYQDAFLVVVILLMA